MWHRAVQEIQQTVRAFPVASLDERALPHAATCDAPCHVSLAGHRHLVVSVDPMPCILLLANGMVVACVVAVAAVVVVAWECDLAWEVVRLASLVVAGVGAVVVDVQRVSGCSFVATGVIVVVVVGAPVMEEALETWKMRHQWMEAVESAWTLVGDPDRCCSVRP